MEDLNRNQFILLVLLVSFVTSIATGIMTFSLLQQAPLEVTRTINQVVEKTIQQVAPAGNILSPSSGQKEVTTVVVKEEDLILGSINKNIQSVVRIKEKDGTTGGMSFFSMGLVVSKDGFIISPRRTITAGNAYSAILSDGTIVELNPTGVDKKTDFMIFKPLKPDAVKSVSFVPVVFASVPPQLGQTVIVLGGDSQDAVSVGRAISFDMKESSTASSTVKYVSGIETDVSTRDMVLGSPLFTLSGDIVGINVSSDGSKTFIPADLLQNELSGLTDRAKTQ